MNRRNKEFAEECIQLLALIGLKVNGDYNNKIEKKTLLKDHMTERMIATEDTALRHLNNLLNKKAIIEVVEHNHTYIKLNPQMANKEIDFLITKIPMPEDDMQQPQQPQPKAEGYENE